MRVNKLATQFRSFSSYLLGSASSSSSQQQLRRNDSSGNWVQFARFATTSTSDGGGSSQSGVMDVLQMRDFIMKVCGATQVYSEHVSQREQLRSLLRDSQDDLEARTISDSAATVTVPLSNPLFRERYLNTNGTIRYGQLLEQLDSFAVHISYQHNSPTLSADGRSPYSMVTAMVDELILRNNNHIDPTRDIKMHGHVSWVGKSSLEITMYMSQHEKMFLETKFLMVARDASGSKSAVVHPLKLTSDADRKMFESGAARKLDRIETAKESLFSTPPTVDEMNLVHYMFLQTLSSTSKSFSSRILPENSVWMDSTKLKNAIVCFPQSRNVHNKVFGGFIMRMALELGWANAYSFTKKRPIPRAIDDIVFHAPVNIGALLLMSSQVCVVDPPYYLVRVRAEISNAKTGELTTSNVFHFTFESTPDEDPAEAEKIVPFVYPKTYGESMLYLDGRRRLAKQILRFKEEMEDI